ncbi:MAG: hypothetical protein HZB41_03395 [Ignavibacteriae bacterium]|nr:hypothetical protein [Ignavibacteriota bacterium]
MKLIRVLLIIAFSYIIICSCNDISSLGNKTEKFPIIPSMQNEDSLKFIDLHLINMGGTRRNQVIYNFAVFNNKSDNLTIIIYDLKAKNKFGFEVYPEKGYPVIFSPLQKNSDNKLVCKWKTDSVQSGYYRDTIYVNNSKKVMFFIDGTVF